MVAHNLILLHQIHLKVCNVYNDISCCIMVKRILAICCLSLNDFKAIVMSMYKNLVYRYNLLQQRMYTESCVTHALLNCHYRWYVLSLSCNICKT